MFLWGPVEPLSYIPVFGTEWTCSGPGLTDKYSTRLCKKCVHIELQENNTSVRRVAQMH